MLSCLAMKELLILLIGISSVMGDCWDTGCQLNSWAVQGCQQYNRVETGRKPCSGGNVYTCCTGSDPPPSSGGDCWETGCQLDSWATKGCAQYQRTENGRRPCPGGQHYTCCAGGGGGVDPGPNPGNGGDANSITQEEFSQAVTSNGYPSPSAAQFTAFKAGLPKGSISSKQEAAMSLANFLHESDGLRAKREYACKDTGCPGSYATPGCDAPGQYYYGRGYIQLSWCYNYKPCSNDLYGDDRLVRDPDMVARDEQVAWDTAFWFWRTRVHDREGVSEGKFGVTVRAINGGLECDGNRQDQARKRFQMYGKVRAAFGLPGNGDERGCYN